MARYRIYVSEQCSYFWGVDAMVKPAYLVTGILQIASAYALNNGLARTPQRGWNPYNAFAYVLYGFNLFGREVILYGLAVAQSNRSTTPKLKF